MKTIFYLTLFFLSHAIYSQAASGRVIYNIKPISFKIADGVDPSTRNMLEQSQLAAEKQSFILEFSGAKSKFILKEVLIQEAVSAEAQFFNKIGSIRFTSSYDYFLDRDEKYELFKDNDGTLIKKKYTKIDWKITPENKVIDGYLCYKAIYNKSYTARDNKTKINTIVAWFAPALPYGFGPKEYNGTPGLILELQEFDTVYYASAINILKDKEIIIDFPKGKTISQEDYTKKVIYN
jgi:GLPGLI family protein